MHSHGPRKNFNKRQCADTYYVPLKNIFKKILIRTTSTGRTYKITDEDYKKLFLYLPNFNNNQLLHIIILLLPFARNFISVSKCLIKKTKT